jgi:hypothetical protein
MLNNIARTDFIAVDFHDALSDFLCIAPWSGAKFGASTP